MKTLFDTNILVSSAMFPQSVAARALLAASLPPNKGIVCEYSIDEMIDVFYRKFSGSFSRLERFLFNAMFYLDFVFVPNETYEVEQLIRDEKDRPILRAAIKHGADILLTGDKDFLESGIQTPRIMSPSEFLELS